jgi:hypothetical protein
MLTRKPGLFIVLLVCSVMVMACALPFMATPTPFVFPTPDMTMTALFAPTNTLEPTATQQPTATATLTATPTATTVPPTNTPEPTATEKAPEPYYPPPPEDHRDGPYFDAQYVKNPPDLNGSWGDWDAEVYDIDTIHFGKDNWKNSNDLSASFMAEWDEDYLYLAWKVTDDKYVQFSKGSNMYKGDSVEVLIDSDIENDYWDDWLNSDDYQIGINPGRDEPTENTEAYMYFPSNKARSLSKVIIGVKKMDGGYRVTAGIPWSYLGVDPYRGLHLGFVASVSDDDSNHGGQQQTMASSSWRWLTDPTTWGDLELVK